MGILLTSITSVSRIAPPFVLLLSKDHHLTAAWMTVYIHKMSYSNRMFPTPFQLFIEV